MDESPLIRYASFIFLGLTLTVGYAVMRAMGAKWTREKQEGEAWLARELEEARAAQKRRQQTLDAPSGLEGPAYDAEQKAVLEQAQKSAQPKDEERPS